MADKVEAVKVKADREKIMKGFAWGLMTGFAGFLLGTVSAPYVAGITGPLGAALGFMAGFVKEYFA